MSGRGRKKKKKYYFGLHYDLHAKKDDTELGLHCSPAELVPLFRIMKPDFVQTDCKGHPGYTSWFSKTPTASVSPKLKKDAMKGWRAATKKLGLPLHCHYSGIWDKAAGEKYPEWCVVSADGKPVGRPGGQNTGTLTSEIMCPRGPYLEKLMIPQMLELIDRYDVDGFWIDGDQWAVQPCYCKLCRKAFAQKTGIKNPPTKTDDPRWSVWWNFTRESFEEYVTRYCDAVHQYKKGVLVCSNWLQTFCDPGEPKVPTDWISGDNAHVWGLDGSRCEARFLSTREKTWDIMLWGFYRSGVTVDAASPYVAKPEQMLMQEAAVLQCFGGGVQLYEHPPVLRDGSLVPWRQKRMGNVGRFVKKRRALCQDTKTIPQVVVLHSEHHMRTVIDGKTLRYNLDIEPVRGAAYSLLENHFGVDIMDEWALLKCIDKFPVVVVPERYAISDEMLEALKKYVTLGGKLLVTGPKSLDRFGGKFLGVTKGKLTGEGSYFVPVADGAARIYSDAWRLVKATTATVLCTLDKTPHLDKHLTNFPGATINKVGKGAVAYIGANVFRDFEKNRYPMTRVFIGKVIRKLVGSLDIKVKAPLCVDVALRKKKKRRIIHMVNRSSGIPNQPNNGAIDEIPAVGPVTITIKMKKKPRKVSLAFEKGSLSSKFAKGKLTVKVPLVHIHSAVVIE